VVNARAGETSDEEGRDEKAGRPSLSLKVGGGRRAGGKRGNIKKRESQQDLSRPAKKTGALRAGRGKNEFPGVSMKQVHRAESLGSEQKEAGMTNRIPRVNLRELRGRNRNGRQGKRLGREGEGIYNTDLI